MTIQQKPFKSSLSSELANFIEIKQASGFHYNEASRVLHHFDNLIADKFPNSTTLTKEICEQWLLQNIHTKTATQMKIVTPVRQFALFLNAIGKPAYVYPSYIPGKIPKYQAHIFSDNEIKAFFASVDKCDTCAWSKAMHLCIPALFRLLYCTGLRSSEARLLRRRDINLDTGKLIIRNSKFRKKRIVMLSDSLCVYLRDYDNRVNAIFPNRDPFFPNERCTFYGKSRFGDWFHMFWDSLPEAAEVVGNTPRLHDFRHTFAVNCINKWVKEGMQVDHMYVYLSEYMGHEGYSETDYYLSLAASFYPELAKKMKDINIKILPEVSQ